VQVVRQAILDTAIHYAGRALLARDLALGRVKRQWEIRPSDHCFSRHKIPSGNNQLDAVLAIPTACEPQAALLICHGIGETVQHWHSVQKLLAAHGVISLVFDYSGYGRSSGKFTARQSECDAINSFNYLEQIVTPLPVALLGFSLGSGIAAAVHERVSATSLLLCAAYTSMRDAAGHIGVPKWLRNGVPPIWRADVILRTCKIPVLIVHGQEDRMFPASMAAKLKACCPSCVEFVLVPGHGHKEPYFRPQISYWGHVVSHLIPPATKLKKQMVVSSAAERIAKGDKILPE
jgi:uncharacterized protein